MRTVTKLAMVDPRRCTGCAVCARICPTTAITMERRGRRQLAVIQPQRCLDCRLCFTRCPEYAVSMVDRDAALEVGTSIAPISSEVVSALCTSAHMYPDQVICYCHRVPAKEIAAAILQGAKTPEDVSLATGARTGCGVLCITGVIRLLRAAGHTLTRAPGYQWLGIHASIWEVPPALQEKYPQYYLAEDLRAVGEVFPHGEKIS